MNNLHLTNSLTNKKEIFNPINKEKVSLYACGPTVYDNPHVGNARALVVFDLLFRILIEIYGEKKVTYIRNITDIDDKIIEASKIKKKDISDLTKTVTKKFHKVYLKQTFQDHQFLLFCLQTFLLYQSKFFFL